jgi:diguanylate cyclase (GGDEF)-like protein
MEQRQIIDAEPHLSRPVAIAVAVVLVILIGIFDFASGILLRVFPLYFFPVGMIAWNIGFRASVGVSLVAITAWEESNRLAGLPFHSIFVSAWNITIQLLSLLFLGWMLDRLRRLMHAERTRSKTDSVTQLPNARAFMEAVEHETVRSKRHRHPMTVAYVDLDGFKAVNDNHGHERGDRVLRAIGDILRTNIRTSDLAARLGGDEFGLLLIEIDAERARNLLDRVRERIWAAMNEDGLAVSASIGAVSFESGDREPQELLQRADELMYRVKKAGRNAVITEHIL